MKTDNLFCRWKFSFFSLSSKAKPTTCCHKKGQYSKNRPQLTYLVRIYNIVPISAPAMVRHCTSAAVPVQKFLFFRITGAPSLKMLLLNFLKEKYSVFLHKLNCIHTGRYFWRNLGEPTFSYKQGSKFNSSNCDTNVKMFYTQLWKYLFLKCNMTLNS